MNIDTKIEQLLKKVEERREGVKKGEKARYKTNCSFRWDGNSTQQLQVVSDPQLLTEMLAFIRGKYLNFEEAKKILGSKVEFTYQGSSYEDWEEDITTRFEVVQLTQSKKELKVLEEKLQSLMSPELKRQKELEEIEALLG